ncbi:transmembrane protein, putative [Rhizoctonia solani AG-3 Rhs1AP]|uniref:Transmembrane protein, putative n=1 Tax=Rhizoctonia solani AG-3 Rhs1AP TaxID=1086054 RepID=X8J6I6_9AGAM|nr:transmembrane protein, putative [Rhizoctonia solani AG-3 Rhs1AP]
MRISIANTRQYRDSGSEELDRRENIKLIKELASHIVPRSPRGGGRGGGGRGGGGKGGSTDPVGAPAGDLVVAPAMEDFMEDPEAVYHLATDEALLHMGAAEVYGNSRYGSGYTYGNGGSSVTGRGFPFGYWPVYVPIAGGAAYYGYHEYGPAHNTSRPGGEMQLALVRSTSWPTVNARRWLEGRQSTNSTNSTTPAANNATASYYIVGDADTVAAIMDELVDACSVVRTSGVAINETKPSIYFEQAVQFYRASSFMLVLTSYNNTADRIPINGTEPSTAVPDTPIPPGTDMNFLNCLNITIGASIPIMDAENNASSPSSNSAVANLQALGGMNVLGLLWILLWLFKLL